MLKLLYTNLFGKNKTGQSPKELNIQGDVTITNYKPSGEAKPENYIKVRTFNNSIFIDEGAHNDSTPEVADFSGKKADILEKIAALSGDKGTLSKEDILKITSEKKSQWGLVNLVVENDVATLTWGKNDILRIDFSEEANKKPLENKIHKVESGEYLSGIAKRNGVTVEQILDVNPGLKADSIYAGQEIIIPLKALQGASQVPINPEPSDTVSQVGISEKEVLEKKKVTQDANIHASNANQKYQCIHTVTSGDSLADIAKKYGIFLQQLVNANPDVAKQKFLQAGDVLYIPYPPTIKSLEDLSQGGKDFLARLRERESRGHGGYKAENFAGYIGAYQMGEEALIDLGVYKKDGTAKNDWKGVFKKNKFGITSKSDFLNSPEKQDKAIIRYMQLTWVHIENEGWNKYVGKTIAGVKVTELGLIAACHLVGRDNVEKFLTSNGKIIPTDGNNPPQPLTKYLGDNGLMGDNKDFILF